MAKLALLAHFLGHSNDIRLIFFPASDKVGSLEEEIPSCKPHKSPINWKAAIFQLPCIKPEIIIGIPAGVLTPATRGNTPMTVKYRAMPSMMPLIKYKGSPE